MQLHGSYIGVVETSDKVDFLSLLLNKNVKQLF